MGRGRKAKSEPLSGVLDINLRLAASTLSGGERRLASDPGLRAYLLNLFDDPGPTRIWTDHLAPFITAHEDDLRHLYLRLQGRPNRLFDYVEVLLVVERLDQVPNQLAENWPRPWNELEQLAANWGMPFHPPLWVG